MGQVTGSAALGTAITTIILWIANAVWGIEVDEAVQGAITTLVVLIAGWLVPPKEDRVEEEVIEVDYPGEETVEEEVIEPGR
jgi:hypothetical protein